MVQDPRVKDREPVEGWAVRAVVEAVEAVRAVVEGWAVGADSPSGLVETAYARVAAPRRGTRKEPLATRSLAPNAGRL